MLLLQEALNQHPDCANPMRTNAQAKAASEALVAAALQRGTLDNVTALVTLLQWD